MSKAKAMGEKVATVDPRAAWEALTEEGRNLARETIRIEAEDYARMARESAEKALRPVWKAKARALRAALALLSEPASSPPPKRPRPPTTR